MREETAIMELGRKTERLFQMVLEKAGEFYEANPHLFRDLAQGLPFEVLGNGLTEKGLEQEFGIIFEGLYLKDRNLLAQLRNRTGKDTAAYSLLDSIIQYQLSMYTARRE